MFNLSQILFGKPLPIRVTRDPYEMLYPPALTMGTLYLGKQGSGKTSSLARHLVEYFDAFPDQAIFAIDVSGDLTNKVLAQFCMRPFAQRRKDAQRLVYDEFDHPEWVLPLPELTTVEESENDIDRVRQNLEGLYHEPSAEAVIMASVAINKILPELMRLLVRLRNVHGECWQVTDLERLLDDPKLLRNAVKAASDLPPGTADHLSHRVNGIKADERDKRTFKLSEMVGWIKTPFVRAKLGYSRRHWTPDEAVRQGQFVIINAANMVNNPLARDYLITQAWSLIKAALNRRVPANPQDRPVSVIFDETKALFNVAKFADEIGDLQPLYRSRKVQLYIVIQALSQLAPELQEKIWLLGNMVIFGLENKRDCEMVAYQLSSYDPRRVKQPARHRLQNPITETEPGQDRLAADWINHLDKRQCLVKRHFDEQHKDHQLRYVAKTKDMPNLPLQVSVEEFKEYLLRDRGIRIRDALAAVDSRQLPPAERPTA